MTEAQLKSFPAFRALPVYDESDERSNTVSTAGRAGYLSIRECCTVAQVEECLGNARLVPLGALRAAVDGGHVVVAYFGEMS